MELHIMNNLSKQGIIIPLDKEGLDALLMALTGD
jgi:hypothetical protein